MAFSAEERAVLLAVKGVGPTVVQRLEQVGIEDLAGLAHQDAGAICAAASAMLGSTCWRNSPQARGAIAAAIEAARAHLADA
ncbi:MAG: Pathogenicity locus [Phenylobacterium sp.]|uniref:helix-hairpin-helix domain-containing protein n=1 Tax=Phenylobacterium sp. TaxID=1871053 RepID=UPI0025E94B55|nr:helix-hairpin-helix domain-containing protein [Phenylobacterium sp.]MBA4013049.1 Pathogenicity locus [Phenylobacterium sp.]